ncbi:hypothetical protein GCM10008020_22970 [Massilia psychrophila]|nr:hypothetical protein GCM10008020_22970 [Massilia psychrophila]
MRFDPVAGFSFAALTLWGRLAVAPGSCEVSDGLLGFEVLERLGYTHKVALDGAMTKAPLGGGKTGPDATDRGKGGVKRSLLTEANGIPIAIEIDGANRHDMKLVERTLSQLMIERPEPTHETPQHLSLDKGHD